METIINADVTQGIVQDDDKQGIVFDDNGEMQLTEAGLAEFKDLLKQSNTDNTARPVVEEDEPEEDESEEKTVAEKEATPEQKTEQSQKHKLKVEGQEIEVTDEERDALAQQGMHYTRKMQELAAERNALTPYQALIQQLNSDPNLSQYIAGYWQQRQPAAQQPPQFEDPIEQLKWEIKQEILGATKNEIAQAITPIQRQTVLNQVKQQVQADPEYNAVHQDIVNMVMMQPPLIQKTMFTQLDQDPQSYVEAFMHFKNLRAVQKQTKTETSTPGETLPEPTKRTERAPILESSNPAPSPDSLKAQRIKIDKAKANALRSGSVEALQSFLEAGGFLDHLV